MNTSPVEILSGRHNPSVDPMFHVWGWEIPVYLFLGGLVAGVMLLLAALELRDRRAPGGRLAWLPFVAVGLLSLGMGALFVDLSHKLYVWRFYTAFRPTSPMSWGSWLLLAVYPALLLLGLGGLDAAQRGWLSARSGPLRGLLDAALRFADAQRRRVLWLSLLLGAGLGAYTGVLLGTLSARPLWSSAVLGPLFLVSGLSSGAALLLLARPDAATTHRLVRWDLAALLVELALIAFLLIGAATGDSASQASVRHVLGGAWTPWFWSLIVVGGLMVPAWLESLELRFGLSTTLWSPLLVLIGGFALRAILVAAGQAAPAEIVAIHAY